MMTRYAREDDGEATRIRERDGEADSARAHGDKGEDARNRKRYREAASACKGNAKVALAREGDNDVTYEPAHVAILPAAYVKDRCAVDCTEGCAYGSADRCAAGIHCEAACAKGGGGEDSRAREHRGEDACASAHHAATKLPPHVDAVVEPRTPVDGYMHGRAASYVDGYNDGCSFGCTNLGDGGLAACSGTCVDCCVAGFNKKC